MKHTRWIVPAWIFLMTGAFIAWGVFAYLKSDSDQADKGGEPDRARTEPDLYGLVKVLDRDQRTITLSAELEEGKEQEQTYELAKDATVLLEDGPASLDDLAIGARVALEFAADRKS